MIFVRASPVALRINYRRIEDYIESCRYPKQNVICFRRRGSRLSCKGYVVLDAISFFGSVHWSRARRTYYYTFLPWFLHHSRYIRWDLASARALVVFRTPNCVFFSPPSSIKHTHTHTRTLTHIHTLTHNYIHTHIHARTQTLTFFIFLDVYGM